MFYNTKDRVNQITRITNKFLNFFFNENSDQIKDEIYDNHMKSRRHLNEYGQIMSAGTFSPDENTVYGRVIYKPEDSNQTEGSINGMKDLQDDGPNSSFKSTPKPVLGYGQFFPSDPESNRNPDNNPDFDKDKFFPPVSVKPALPPVFILNFDPIFHYFPEYDFMRLVLNDCDFTL